MKKILLSAFFLTTVFSAVQAQSLETANFETLTVGNLTTDVAGTAAGQGGFLVNAVNGAVTEVQVVTEGGVYGKVLQVTGSPVNNNHFIFKQGLAATWGARTAGNNVVDIEYDFFTGPATASINTQGLRIYNAAGQSMVGISFLQSTKEVRGVARFDNAGTIGSFLFTLGPAATAGGASTPLILPVNTWVRVGLSFNKTTGEVRWKGPGFEGFVMGAATGTDINEIDILVTGGGTANAASAVAKFDNITATARAASALLSTKQNTIANFNVYPNPTSNLLNIANVNNLQIQSAVITDINGRVIKEVVANEISTIDVSDLTTGIYFLKVTSADGTGITKFIKQ